MVSKKAMIGIAFLVVIIGFVGAVLLEAERLQVSPQRSTSILLTGGGFTTQCDRFNCFALGTEIPNSCLVLDSTRVCTIQLNDLDNPRTFTETESSYIIQGENTKCFLEGDGFGGVARDPLLQCVDNADYSKLWWILREETVNLDQFVVLTVIGDQSFGERTTELQRLGTIGLP